MKTDIQRQHNSDYLDSWQVFPNCEKCNAGHFVTTIIRHHDRTTSTTNDEPSLSPKKTKLNTPQRGAGGRTTNDEDDEQW